jgi:hypothetical protein
LLYIYIMEASETHKTFEMNVLEGTGIVVLEPAIEDAAIEDILSELPFNDANEVFREMHEEEEGEQQYNIGELNDEMFAGPATKIASGSFNTVFSKGELGIRISKEPVDIDDELIENQDIWLSLNSVDVTPKLYFYGLLKYKSEYEPSVEYYLIIVNKLYRNNLSDFIRRRPPSIIGEDERLVIDPDKGWYTRLRNRFIEINNKLIVAEEGEAGEAGEEIKKKLRWLFRNLFTYIHTEITKQLKYLVIETVKKGIFCSDIKTLNIVIYHNFDKLIDMLSEEEEFLNNLLADPGSVLKSFKDGARMDIKFIDVDYTENNMAGCKKNVSKIVEELTSALSQYEDMRTRETSKNRNILALSEKFMNIKGRSDMETLSLIVIIFLKLMLIANHLFKDGYNVLYTFFKDDYGPSILQMWTPNEHSENKFVQSLLLFLEIFFERTKEVTDEIYRQQLRHYFGLGINEITPYDLYWRAASYNEQDKSYIDWMPPVAAVGEKRRRGQGGKKKKKKTKKKKSKKKKTNKKYYKRNTFK